MPLMPAAVPEQIYPDVAAFGSLAAALRATAERDGLDLDEVAPAQAPGWINVGARVARADRIASVVMASEVRAFSSELWSKGVCLSGGATGDLEMTAGLLAAPGGAVVVEGVNARDAAAAVASSLPPGLPPAVAGTANDLA